MFRKNINDYAKSVVTSNVNVRDAVTWPRDFRVYELKQQSSTFRWHTVTGCTSSVNVYMRAVSEANPSTYKKVSLYRC